MSMTAAEYRRQTEAKRSQNHDAGSEFADQCAIFQWASLQESVYPDLALLFSTLNGVRLPIGLAVKAKASGNKKGVPDIVLPVPIGRYHGMFIELKYGNNKPSPEQLGWIKALTARGYCCVICWGWEEAVQHIKNYLDAKI
jgi:hypothetical protein